MSWLVGEDSRVTEIPSGLLACSSFAVGLGEHTEVGGLGTAA